MAMLRAIFIYVLVVLFYSVGSTHLQNDMVSGGGVKIRDFRWKMDLLSNGCKPTAHALRKIKIPDRASELQLAGMVVTYLGHLREALNSFNTLVSDNEDFEVMLNGSNNYINDMQQLLFEQPEIMKETLASRLETTASELLDAKKFIKFSTELMNVQLEHWMDILMYGLNKLKFEALYFEETDKQLCNRMSTVIDDLTDAMTRFSSTDKRALVELRHHVLLFERFTEKIINRLQVWIELNSKDTKNVEMFEEIIMSITKLFERETQAFMSLHTVAALKTEIVAIFVTGAKTLSKVSKMELSENSVANEYIRSLLFDGITILTNLSESFRKMPYRP